MQIDIAKGIISSLPSWEVIFWSPRKERFTFSPSSLVTCVLISNPHASCFSFSADDLKDYTENPANQYVYIFLKETEGDCISKDRWIEKGPFKEI